ncbi:TetR/AcrR family transcriptional regulator [Arthrobacter sp. GCM10027362]|uniref:TetR/AcrR family transcriptional regulator n=1 Tax=Arthrobacter sp. GCM10027362 TaxID=3273379 RepID=UPI003638A94E
MISATAELMKREGVQSITLRAIAKEAGAPLAAVHYCFNDKDELMDAAAEHWLRHMSRFSTDVPVDSGLRKALEHVAEGYWGLLEEAPEDILAQVELVTWATRNSAGSPLAARIYPAYEAELGRVFSTAAEKSAEQSRLDFKELARAFITIFDGAALQYMADPDSGGHRDRYFMMIDALLAKAGV